MIKIDSYTHMAPPRFRDEVLRRLDSELGFDSWRAVPSMADVGLRIEIMDEFGIDAQVVCTPSPPLEETFGDADAIYLARLANEEIAEVVSRHLGRFVGVATVPLGDVDAAALETERAVNELGMRGVLMYTSQRGRPIDRPELEEYYDLVEELGIPIWLHPERSAAKPDYDAEDRSRYGMFLIFGWPYETTLAMARLVLSGVMERHPGLKVIAHHAGAMIPRMINRIGTHYNNQPRIELPDLSLPVADYFKRFYVDTVTQGSVPALRAAHGVFGPDKLLFASDLPFGGDNGRNFLRHEMQALEELPLDETERQLVWGGNLMAICGLEPR